MIQYLDIEEYTLLIKEQNLDFKTTEYYFQSQRLKGLLLQKLVQKTEQNKAINDHQIFTKGFLYTKGSHFICSCFKQSQANQQCLKSYTISFQTLASWKFVYYLIQGIYFSLIGSYCTFGADMSWCPTAVRFSSILSNLIKRLLKCLSPCQQVTNG